MWEFIFGGVVVAERDIWNLNEIWKFERVKILFKFPGV
jgi:hypothetical protein